MADEEPDPRRWRALWVCLLVGFMTLLDVSIVNVALPSMQQGLGASPEHLSWIVSGYVLTFGIALVPAGKLGDDFGRKPMFMAGLGLFVLASVLCGVALSPLWLVLARLLQGVAGGLLNPQVVGTIQQLFRGQERGTAFGWFGTTIGVSTAVGPIAGGLLLQWAGTEHGWRLVFFVNVPIGVVALLAAARLLPADRAATRWPRLDLFGALLLGLGVVALMLPLIEAERDPAGAPWYLFAAGAVLLALFVYWERSRGRRGRRTLVDLSLLRMRPYAMGTTLGLFYFAGFTGIFFVCSLFFQRGLGYSPLQAGAALLPFAVGGAVSSVLAGRVTYRLGRPLVVYGLVAVLVGLVATALIVRFAGSDVGVYTAAPLLLAGLGSGSVISPNQTLALDRVPPAEGGTAAGVLQTCQRLGTAVGTAIAGWLLFSTLSGGGDYPAATSTGLFGSLTLVGLALVVGLADLVLGRRRRGEPQPEPAPALRIDGTVLERDLPSRSPVTVTVTTDGGREIGVTRPGPDGGYHMVVPEAGRYLVAVRAGAHEPQVSAVDVDTEATGVDFCFACAFTPSAQRG